MATKNENKGKKKTEKKWESADCKFQHDAIKKEFNIIDEKLITIEKHNNKQLEDIKNAIENENAQEHTQINDKIKVVSESIHTKLDEFDQSFRGNGRIGVFEEIRALKKEIENLSKIVQGKITDFKGIAKMTVIGMIKIIFILVVLVIGGRYYGLTLNTPNEKNDTMIKKIDEGVKDKNNEDKSIIIE